MCSVKTVVSLCELPNQQDLKGLISDFEEMAMAVVTQGIEEDPTLDIIFFKVS